MWYQQQLHLHQVLVLPCCDLLENIYLCGINNNYLLHYLTEKAVVICLKISIFVASTTTGNLSSHPCFCCDLLENIYLCGINNNLQNDDFASLMLWFAWKYLSLWHQQQLALYANYKGTCCDLLENIYLCGINNNLKLPKVWLYGVVICLKISIFVASTTTQLGRFYFDNSLWFAWKYLSLWHQQQQLLALYDVNGVVICLKISIFVASTTTHNL